MQIDWWTLAIQTINFLVVIWLLSRFLYRPIRRIIEQREAAGREVREKAAKAAEEAEKARRDYEQRRAELDAAQRDKEAELHTRLEAERTGILEAARQEASELLEQARARTERERADAIEALHGRIADLATGLARKALAGWAHTTGDNVQEVTAYLDGLSETDRAELREDLSGEGCKLIVASAAPLSGEAQQRWRDVLRARLGDDLRLSFEETPEILGGVELRFPHSRVAFSVAERLRRAAEQIRE